MEPRITLISRINLFENQNVYKMKSEKVQKEMNLKDIMQWLSPKSRDEKVEFCELLLQEITVMNRAIWSDEKTSALTKVECFKWSNEFVHRIWNLIRSLRNESDEHAEFSLFEDFRFYAKRANELAAHMGAAMRGTVLRFSLIQNKIDGN